MKSAIILSIFLIPLAICTTASAAPVKSWGVSAGDKLTYTMGWKFNLALDSSTWALINSEEGFDVQQAYNDILTIPSLFHVELTVAGINNNPMDPTYGNIDTINYTVKMKQASSSTYLDMNAFLSDLTSSQSALIDSYQSLLHFNATELQNELSSLGTFPPLSEIWSVTGNIPLIPMLVCVPTDYDFSSILNTYSTMIPYSELGLGVSNLNDLLSQFGTKIIVTEKQAAFEFQYNNLNMTILDAYATILSSTPTTWNAFLATMGISNPSATVKENLQYDSDGVLLNAHFELSGGLTMAGSGSNSVSVAFDISKGQNSDLNAQYNDPFKKGIPGYSILFMLLSGMMGIVFVAMIVKKRRA